MVDRMRINQSQASLLSATGLTKIEPGVSGLQVMPMMFRSLDEVDYVGQKLRPVLNKRLRENGFIVLFWGDTGWVRFFTNRPAVTPDDIRKLKLFTWAGHTPTVDLFRASGFNVVPLETGDILTGLQTGLIDGVPMPPFFALASQVYGPAPYMLEINWAPLVGALVIKRQTWEAIPFEIRMKMMAAAHIAGEEITATGRTESVASVRAMETKWGLQVHTPDSATRALWAQQSALAYNTIRGGIVPEEIYDEVQIHLSEYRQNGLSEAVATTTDTNR
jgi:TRAP-type C4-dicarboxylate transport system substrate-binding protein